MADPVALVAIGAAVGGAAGRLAERATETTLGLATQLASDAISRCTKRQLTLLAFCCFMEEVRPHTPLAATEFKEWVSVFFGHFETFRFHPIDARHLVAIGCVSYDPTSGKDLDIMLGMKGKCIGTSFHDVEAVENLRFSWAEGLAGVELTSVGSIVGGLALDKILNSETGLPSWASE